MEIRMARLSDLDVIEEIYSKARSFMRKTGNTAQWAGGYPSRNLIISDIEKEQLYVVTDSEQILASFVYFYGVDKTYAKIYDGEWKNDLPYGVIHRIAVAENAHGRGVARFCFDFAFEKCGNLKIDTHKDNLPMQKALTKAEFEYCGIICLESGDERLAYQKV
ncbi:MAG: GNAT family N-acetyltransferase [Clostridia bacterium]|nr:GNAT family N-acetyltransferase [Clostridia bacterium]